MNERKRSGKGSREFLPLLLYNLFSVITSFPVISVYSSRRLLFDYAFTRRRYWARARSRLPFLRRSMKSTPSR